MNNYYCRNALGQFCKPTVGSLPDVPVMVFVSDSQETNSIKNYLGDKAQEYDSFFVIVGDGDYDAVWGMYNIIPYTHKAVYRIV